MKLIQVASVAFATLAAANTAGVVKLDYDIVQVDTVVGKHAQYSKRDKTLDMDIFNKDTYYYAKLEVGSNKQEVEVLVDTGSSDLWMMSNDTYCFVPSSSSYKRRDVLTGHKPSNIKLVGTPLKDEESELLSEIILFTEIPDVPSWSDYPDFSNFIWSEATAAASAPPEYINSAELSEYYESATTCFDHGSFNTDSSDSFSVNDTVDAFYIAYADGTEATGTWGQDSVIINGITVKDVNIAVANVSSSNIGVLGVGLPELEETYDSSGSSYTYENLPVKLKRQGAIGKTLYSIYLNKQTAKLGTILFGGVDHSKYKGTLEIMKIVKYQEESSSEYSTEQTVQYKDPARFIINLDSIAYKENDKTSDITTKSQYALLDSGSTLTYLPLSVISLIAKSLDLKYLSEASAYKISCSVDDDKYLVYKFGNTSIEVPLSDLVLQETKSSCYLGIIETDEDYGVLGDNFLRNAYAVFDLDDYKIALAPINFTDKEDIEAVTGSIPGNSSSSSSSSDSGTSRHSSASGSSSSDSDSSSDTSSSNDGSSSSDSSSSDKKESSAVFTAPSLFVGLLVAVSTLLI